MAAGAVSVDLIIGGASKAGTTALYEMLGQHPEIFLPVRKELHFFSRSYLEDSAAGPGDAAVVAEIPSTLDAYLSHYQKKRDNQVAVEVSPSYLFHHGSAAKIAAALPEAKVLFCLRHPVEKIFSQYVHLVGEGRETLSFEAALEAEATRKDAGYSDMWLYSESGFYADAVAAFQAALGADRVKVILFDHLRQDPEATLAEICEFAGLSGPYRFDTDLTANASGAPRSVLLARAMSPNGFTNTLRRILPTRLGQLVRRVLRAANTAEKPTLAPATRVSLQSRYADDIARLETLIGRETGWLSDQDPT